MNELAVPQQRATADLMNWALSAKEVHTVARIIAGTEFVPRAMRDRPEAVMAAVLTGRELGLSPMVSLAAIDVINGKPALNALALRGLVQSHGHTVEVVEANATRVLVRARRKDSSHWEASEWTIDRARKAGLAGKDTWTKSPQQMLTARATSEVCRLIAADIIVGLAYSQEELGDGTVDEQAVAPPPVAAPKTRTLRRALQPVETALKAEPAPEPEAEMAESEDDDGPATYQQRNQLGHVLGDLGKDKIEFVRLVTGRDNIATSKDLTRGEAAKCISEAEKLLGEATQEEKNQ